MKEPNSNFVILVDSEPLQPLFEWLNANDVMNRFMQTRETQEAMCHQIMSVLQPRYAYEDEYTQSRLRMYWEPIEGWQAIMEAWAERFLDERPRIQ